MTAGDPWPEPAVEPFDLSSIDRFLDEQRLLLQWPEPWPEPWPELGPDDAGLPDVEL